jgi:hypothetical protein
LECIVIIAKVQAFIYIYLSMDLTIVLSTDLYKTGMITMFSNSLIQQHNVKRSACYITIKVVLEDSSCSMVGWGARAACT